jgi:hypothetical protein
MVGGIEGPEQFVWRGRLWKVCAVVAHWVETGPWWHSAGVHTVLGSQEVASGGLGGGTVAVRQDTARGVAEPAEPAGLADLAAEREVWRVEAARGRAAVDEGKGVFDLVFDWADGGWQLARCVD